MERANLEERPRVVDDLLIAQWNECNATMMPLDPQSSTVGFTGAGLTARRGTRRRHGLFLTNLALALAVPWCLLVGPILFPVRWI